MYAMQTDLRDGDRIPMLWDDFLQLPDSVFGEFIDGCLVVSPSPTQRHQIICGNLVATIDRQLACRVIQGWAWKPALDEFIPDVMAFDETDEQKRLTSTPHLAVEVLSTDRAADLIRKFEKYARAGLEHYWVVDPEAPEIVVYRLGEDGVFHEMGRHGPGTVVTLPTAVGEVSLDPGSLLG